jgi:hypothetical protein
MHTSYHSVLNYSIKNLFDYQNLNHAPLLPLDRNACLKEKVCFWRSERAGSGKIEIGTQRVDVLVENRVMLELKALIRLVDVHLAQARNYLETFRLSTGLLINFGAHSLEFKRLIKHF